MALSSDDLPALTKPANATLGLAAKRFWTWVTISSMPSRGTGLRTMGLNRSTAKGVRQVFWPTGEPRPCSSASPDRTRYLCVHVAKCDTGRETTPRATSPGTGIGLAARPSWQPAAEGGSDEPGRAEGGV